LFLAFSTSSQKNLNFQRSLEHVRLLTCYILKSPIFLIRGDVDKKNQKIKIKSKFTKKEVEGPSLKT
jgi:hypothetical protein